jgi:hypothetical protein
LPGYLPVHLGHAQSLKEFYLEGLYFDEFSLSESLVGGN